MDNSSRGENRNQLTRRDVAQMLADSHSFAYLDSNTQNALTDALTQITGYLGNDSAPATDRYGVQMAPPNLQQQLSPQNRPAGGAPSPVQPAVPTGGAPAASGATATGRVGDVTRATLNAISFPEFVASLIKGTFQAITEASIQQMEAYAELLKNVAMSLDDFMTDNVTNDAARDYLADNFDGYVTRDTSGGTPSLKPHPNAGNMTEMPSFLKDLGIEAPGDIDEDTIEEKMVPAARKSMAERRQQTLATMVLMGINRIVVDEGEILAKLVFHIDASESMSMRFDQNKNSKGGMMGGNSTTRFGGEGIMVNTASLNAQSDINVRADLTGQVKVKFRSETFPLERFADSPAIQLINENAKVPQPQAAPPAPAAVPAQPVASVSTEPGEGPRGQGLGTMQSDPWSPM